MLRAAVVYSCCGVCGWGFTYTPCWNCGEVTGRDAWTETDPTDYDGVMARRTIRMSDYIPKESPI